MEHWQPIRNQEVNAASAMSGSNDSAAAYSTSQPSHYPSIMLEIQGGSVTKTAARERKVPMLNLSRSH